MRKSGINKHFKAFAKDFLCILCRPSIYCLLLLILFISILQLFAFNRLLFLLSATLQKCICYFINIVYHFYITVYSLKDKFILIYFFFCSNPLPPKNYKKFIKSITIIILDLKQMLVKKMNIYMACI